MTTADFVLPADKIALASKLFNDFYKSLDSNGMRLLYDHECGCWYVAPNTTEDCTDDEEGALNDEDLETVTNANALGDVDVPWFTGCGYTIRKRRDCDNASSNEEN